MRQPLAHQCSKRAKALRIFVRVLRAGSIEAHRADILLHSCDLIRRHKNELSLWIEKTSDKPAGCGAVNLNSLACDPLHLDLQCPRKDRARSGLGKRSYK